MSQRLLLLPFLLVGSFVGTGCRSEPAPPPAPATSLARPERARPARPQPPPLGQVTEDPEVLARLVAEGTRVAFAARTGPWPGGSASRWPPEARSAPWSGAPWTPPASPSA